MERTFAKAAGQGAAVSIEQYRVGTGPGAAEQAEIKAAASQSTVRSVDAEVADLVDRLALVAGVDEGQIMVDRDNKHARVAATPLPGAQLAAYHLLEIRVARIEPGWTISLVPPAAPLPDISFGEDDTPDAAGRAALAEVIWAAKRLGLAIDVRGPAARTTPVIEALTKAGVVAERVGSGRGVTLDWAVPPATVAVPAAPAATPAATPTPAPRR